MNSILLALTSTFPFKGKENGRWDLCLYKEDRVTRDGTEPQLLPVFPLRSFSFLQRWIMVFFTPQKRGDLRTLQGPLALPHRIGP